MLKVIPLRANAASGNQVFSYCLPADISSSFFKGKRIVSLGGLSGEGYAPGAAARRIRKQAGHRFASPGKSVHVGCESVPSLMRISIHFVYERTPGESKSTDKSHYNQYLIYASDRSFRFDMVNVGLSICLEGTNVLVREQDFCDVTLAYWKKAH